MSLPSVTALCCTYGRTKLLEESIECFRRQDYEGERHLVVVNDLREQRLVWPDCPANVRIVNLDTRLPSLGAKKNVIASFAQTELIINWSDDDIHLPNRISSNVAAYSPASYVVEGGGWFFYNMPTLGYDSGGLCGPFLMSRQDYWRVGGMPDENVGEDQKFIAIVKKSLKIVKRAAPSYIYRWNTGRYHISGHGFNNGGWEKVAEQVRATLANGKEPSGIVDLHPQWREDYVALAQQALERFNAKAA